MGSSDFLALLVPLTIGIGVLAWLAARKAQRNAINSLDSRQPATVAPAGTGQLPTSMDGYGYLAVVGESQYQLALRLIEKRHGRICWAKLVPEPDNPFDRNAVMVEIDGHTVGYLSRAEARRYQRRLLPLASPIPAKLIGGTEDKPSFGVLLDHRKVEALPTPKRARKRRTEIFPEDQPF